MRWPLSHRDMLGWFRSPSETTISVGAGGVSEIAPENADRVVLIVACAQATNGNLTLVNAAGSVHGVVLNNTQGPFVLTTEEHGGLCQAQWFVVGAAGTRFTRFELILDREPTVKEYSSGARLPDIGERSIIPVDWDFRQPLARPESPPLDGNSERAISQSRDHIARWIGRPRLRDNDVSG